MYTSVILSPISPQFPPLLLIFIERPVFFQNPERVTLLVAFFVDSFGEKKYHTRSFDLIFDNAANRKPQIKTTWLISRWIEIEKLTRQKLWFVAKDVDLANRIGNEPFITQNFVLQIKFYQFLVRRTKPIPHPIIAHLIWKQILFSDSRPDFLGFEFSSLVRTQKNKRKNYILGVTRKPSSNIKND